MKKLLFILLLTIPFFGFGQNENTKIYYENGQLQYEVSFKNGEEDGPIKSYHQNGKIWYEGKYVNGKEDGIVRVYSKNGVLEFEGNYKKGDLTSQKCWDEDGDDIECE